MRTTRSTPFALLLLFCLLFAQWAAGAHALTHLPAAHAAQDGFDAPDGEGKGAAHVCFECLAGHGLDLAAPPPLVGLTLAVATGFVAIRGYVPPARTSALRPNSRAPPAFL